MSPTRRALPALLLAPALARAQTLRPGPQGTEGLEMREQIWRIPVPARRGEAATVLLEATVFRPAGPGPFPVALISHGQAEGEAGRRQMNRPRFPNAARVLTAEGFCVLLPQRRGFGSSEGDFQGGTGGCERMDLMNNAETGANDIAAVLAWMRGNMPFCDPTKVLLIGQSAGGFASLAAAGRRLPGVFGVVNFAGGLRAGSRDGVTAAYCDGWQDRLVATIGQLGARAAGVPTLWFYAYNDSYFGFGLGRRMQAAWVAAGGTADFVEPPYRGRDGHQFFSGDQSVGDWQGPVRAFLRRVRAV